MQNNKTSVPAYKYIYINSVNSNQLMHIFVKKHIKII